MRSSPLNSNGRLQRKSRLRKVGPKQKEWKKFRDEKAERDRDDEGLLYCQDYKIGLPKCTIGRPNLDLHHIVGREKRPDLVYDESNLVWLTRSHHDDAHNKG